MAAAARYTQVLSMCKKMRVDQALCCDRLLAAKLGYEYIARKASGQRRVWQWWSHVWGAATGFTFAALYLEGGDLSRLPKSVVPPISFG